MGEAKRRKQLGLMPTVFPFRAELGRDGDVRLLQGPDDAQHRALIEKALRDSQSFGAAWDAEYRTVTVLQSRSGERYTTREDVERIPVPPLRQMDGELALGPVGQPSSGAVIPVEGGSVRLREQRSSFEGEQWQPLPTLRDPQQVMRALQQHPAFNIEGESLGQFQVDHWQAGRIDVTPDLAERADADALEFFETLVQEFHGQTPAEWAEKHRTMLELAQEESELTPEHQQALEAAQQTEPVARRAFFEIRRSAPLQSPLMATAYFRDLEFYLLRGAAYTLDGDVWHPYEDPNAEIEGGGLAPELAEFFDLNMLTVTVYADGRLEWDEDEDLSDEHVEQLRTDLTESTGAGDPAAWKTWTRQALTETFGEELDLPADADFPVPVAVRLEIPRDVLGDDSPLAQTYMESEITFDGENWRDLYEEEVPEELLPFATGRGSN